MAIKDQRLLSEVKPDWYAELHPTRNAENGIDIQTLLATSKEKVWWQCEKGHAWQTSAISRKGCPFCRSAGNKNIQDNAPELLPRWNYEKNKEIEPSWITPSSKREVWWKCKNNHEFLAPPRNFLTNFKCAECLDNVSELEENPVERTNKHRRISDIPELATRWNHFRNGALTPSMLFINRKTLVWWICDEGHEGQYIVDKMYYKKGKLCDVCKALNSKGISKKKLSELQAVEDMREPYIPGQVSKEAWEYIYSKDNADSIASLNTYVAKHWHPDLNGARTPENHSAKAHTWVWLRCENNHDHLFELNGSKEVMDECEECNRSLLVKNPALVSQWWDAEKNTLEPAIILYNDGSHLVWWKCENGHSFQRTVLQMSRMKNKCNDCLKFSDNNLTVAAPHIALQWHPLKNGELRPEDFTRGSERKVWWQCHKCSHEWQAVIKNRVINGTRCAQCPTEGKKGALDEKHPDVFANLDIEKTKMKGINPMVLGHTSVDIVSWKCSVNPSHTWDMSPAELLQSKILCPECNSNINME